MRIKEIAVVRRENGFFHHQGRKIKAYYPRRGYAVMVFLEPSPIDKDFETFVWVPSAKELKDLLRKMDESDRKTYDLLGRGWDHGPRPYLKVSDFM
jgi:hypothetical protein